MTLPPDFARIEYMLSYTPVYMGLPNFSSCYKIECATDAVQEEAQLIMEGREDTASMERVGVYVDPIFIAHRTGPFHPESPQRLEVLYSMLEEDEVSRLCKRLQSRKAEREEITLIHSSSHFDRVAETAGIPQSYLDADTQTSEDSFNAALHAAGAVLDGIDLIMSGSMRNIFALVRPPGHHAEGNRAMGFCLFNNIAIGALYAIEKYTLERVLIIDWDLHHGNGTQHSFYGDQRVLYFSTHQFPFYPGTGDFGETGSGRGRGFSVNVPLGMGYGDADFSRIFVEVLEPIADLYKPQLVLVSAGFDTHFDDPLGGMKMTLDGYATLTGIIQHITRKHTEAKLLLTLEGGYSLSGLRDSVRAVIEQLAGTRQAEDETAEITGHDRSTDRIIETVAQVQREFWSCF
jgi:acetoin utilization deacetylase AcuC-like enzyme